MDSIYWGEPVVACHEHGIVPQIYHLVISLAQTQSQFTTLVLLSHGTTRHYQSMKKFTAVSLSLYNSLASLI